MDIANAKDARQFITAWAEAPPARRAWIFRHAAEGQATCAALSATRGHAKASADHLAASLLLERAARRADREAAR